MSNGTNGNGTSVYDAAPLSKWVRPILGLVGGLVFITIGASLVISAAGSGEWNVAGIILAAIGGFGAYYFGVRNQDKDKDALKTLANRVTEAVDKLPKVNGGQAASTVEDVESTEEGVPVVQPIYEPFNAVDFDAEVESSVAGNYGVRNDATKFYQAWSRGTVSQRYDPEDPEWASYIRKLVNRYFSSIWGLKDESGNLMDTGAVEYATLHINDDKGCTTCESQGCTYPDLKFKARQMGEGYYVSLLWVERVSEHLAG